MGRAFRILLKVVGIVAGAVVLLTLALIVGSVLPAKRSPTWTEALEKAYGIPAYKTVDLSKPLGQQLTELDFVGRSYRIPTIYLDTVIDGDQPLDGILLLYVLPDYTHRADFPNREAYHEARKARRFGHMLVEPEAKRPSFEVMLENQRRDLAKLEAAGTHDGLEVEKWYRGLPHEMKVWSTVYVEKGASGEVISRIECDAPSRPAARFPGCNHKFRHGNLLYDIYYNEAKYFSQWREQRRSAIEFFESFEIAEKYVKGELQ